MDNQKKEQLLYIAKITGKLLLITVLTAVILSLINSLTAPIVLRKEEEKKNTYIRQLFSESTETISLDDQLGSHYPDSIAAVYAVFQGDVLIGYAVETGASGFNDIINMMVCINTDNTVRGVRVLSISETPGVGMPVAEQSYLQTYEGLHYPVTFDNPNNRADALAGATYSSRAILNGVNNALLFCSAIEYTDHSEHSAVDTQTEATTEEVTEHE